MDHLKHFGLKDDPFRNKPQLDSYFESRSHADAVRRLSRCAHQRKELGLLVGEAGSGKTTVARVLFEALDPDVYDVALLVVARGAEPEWLRAGIAQQLGIESPSASRAECAKQLYAQLVEICEAGRRAVVLVDEAHALDAAALAELRALLNFEHEEQRLLTVLLVGHAALVKALEQDPVLQGRVEEQRILVVKVPITITGFLMLQMLLCCPVVEIHMHQAAHRDKVFQCQDIIPAPTLQTIRILKSHTLMICRLFLVLSETKQDRTAIIQCLFRYQPIACRIILSTMNQPMSKSFG